MLAFGLLAQMATATFVVAPAALIPFLHTQRGMSLAVAGVIAGASNLGMVLMLIVWGAITDRYGERGALSWGLFLTALCGLGAIVVQGYVLLTTCLLLGGMSAASSGAASGRVVVGWFPKHRRGLAMGIRQMGQPLGMALVAFVIPAVAQDRGIAAALLLPFALCSMFALLCAVFVENPPRQAEAEVVATNPYSGSRFLIRIHIVSVLLVVPQFTVSTFGLVWLISDFGWSPFAAGLVVGGAQLVGAIGRIGVGMISDRVGSRVRPLRWVAVSAAVVMLLWSATVGVGWHAIAVVVYVTAAIVTVADNGLAFTSVAEYAGPAWSGRALGVQNTGQFIAAAAVSPLMGLLITAVGYPWSFAINALFPVVAGVLVPDEDYENDRLL
jgi:MFS family permease